MFHLRVRSFAALAVLATVAFSMLISSRTTKASAPVFRVEGAGAEANPRSYHGPCPGVIKFKSKIQASGAGRVTYTWLRSDGATAPVEYLDFTEPGVRYVETSWTLGDASVLPAYSGWEQVKIISPNEMLSNRAPFTLTCEKPAAPVCSDQSRTIAWAGRVVDASSDARPEVGPPDNLMNTLSPEVGGARPEVAEFSLLGDFRGGRTYAGLAAMLGIPESTLARADIIAFEGNGGGPGESGGFESCHWVFGNGVRSYPLVFDARRDWRTIPGVVATGTISYPSTPVAGGRRYGEFFGIAPLPAVYYSYLLIDLPPDLDPADPAFTVKITGGRHPEEGESDPDVDAVGVISCGRQNLQLSAPLAKPQ